jgi:hypothetical protein
MMFFGLLIKNAVDEFLRPALAPWVLGRSYDSNCLRDIIFLDSFLAEFGPAGESSG